MKLFIKLLLLLLPILCDCQIQYHNISLSENKLEGYIENNYFLGGSYNPFKKLIIFAEHSFYVENLKYQKFDLGLKYPVFKKNHIQCNLNSAFFGRYYNIQSLFYFSPEIIFFYKSIYLAVKFDVHKELIDYSKFSFQAQTPIFKNTFALLYYRQSLQSYYIGSNSMDIGGKLLVNQNLMTGYFGFETPDDFNYRHIRFIIGIMFKME